MTFAVLWLPSIEREFMFPYPNKVCHVLSRATCCLPMHISAFPGHLSDLPIDKVHREFVKTVHPYGRIRAASEWYMAFRPLNEMNDQD